MNFRTLKKSNFLWVFFLFSLFFSACSVTMNSVVSKDYNAQNKSILILISYDDYTEKLVSTFEKEFMRQAVNSKNKIDFYIVPPRRISGKLELNNQTDTAEKIKAKIAEVSADIVISIVSEHKATVNGSLAYVRYLATGRETVENTEVWKSRIELNSNSGFGKSYMGKKMAKEFYNKLVSDRIIYLK